MQHTLMLIWGMLGKAVGALNWLDLASSFFSPSSCQRRWRNQRRFLVGVFGRVHDADGELTLERFNLAVGDFKRIDTISGQLSN